MARRVHDKDISATLNAASEWINECLVADGSMFAKDLWQLGVAKEVQRAFDDHPDYGTDDFMTKLRGQMKSASSSAQRLMAEMLWALLLFPSNMKARTKRQQIRDIWSLSGEQLAENNTWLSDSVLMGIGSGGPGFNNYRPDEMSFLIAIVVHLKERSKEDRHRILTDYESFMAWIVTVTQKGNRQFRHMLRYFAFPDRVERMSSNNDRRKILEAFGEAPMREIASWSDRELDDRLLKLRTRLLVNHNSSVLDFYEPLLKKHWARERVVETASGAVTVTVPADEEDTEAVPAANVGLIVQEPRQTDASKTRDNWSYHRF
jgi:5-methylcytosine-specific restriction enzyme B